MTVKEFFEFLVDSMELALVHAKDPLLTFYNMAANMPFWVLALIVVAFIAMRRWADNS